MLGATPVFVDIDPRTFNIDSGKLRAAIEKVEPKGQLRPKGIIPVDLFGLPADYDSIMSLAKPNDLFLIEDAAQSFGAIYNGRRAGSLTHKGDFPITEKVASEILSLPMFPGLTAQQQAQVATQIKAFYSSFNLQAITYNL